MSLVIAQLLSLVPPLIGSLGVSLSLVIARLLSSCVTLDRISRHLVTRGAILATRGVIHAYHAAGQRRRQIVVAVVRRRLLRVYLMHRRLVRRSVQRSVRSPVRRSKRQSMRVRRSVRRAAAVEAEAVPPRRVCCRTPPTLPTMPPCTCLASTYASILNSFAMNFLNAAEYQRFLMWFSLRVEWKILTLISTQRFPSSRWLSHRRRSSSRLKGRWLMAGLR